MFVSATAAKQAKFNKARGIAGDRDFNRVLNVIDQSAGPSGCWNSTASKTRDGYGQIRIGGNKRRIHRVMFQWFYPDVDFIVVRHTCNNPSCCNPAHLRGGTQKDNAADRKNSGREGDHKGTKNGRAKLNETDVIQIRKSALSLSALSKMFGVSKQVVSSIKKRKSWKHVTE